MKDESEHSASSPTGECPPSYANKMNDALSVFADSLDVADPEILRYLTDQMQVGIQIIDSDMRRVFSNRFFSRMLGYRCEELHDMPMEQLTDEEGRRQFQQYVIRRRQGISETHPFTFLHKDGHPVHTTIHTSPIFDRHGNFQGAVALIHDETKRVMMEQEIARNEARFRSITQFTGSLIWEVDPNGLYTFVDENVEKLVGYTREEMCGKMHFYDLTPSGAREKVKSEGLAMIGSRQPIRNYLNPAKTRDGREIWIRTNGIPAYDEQGNYTGYQGIGTDVTESRRLGMKVVELSHQMEELRGMTLQARESERAMLARELHDQFGQSLTAIRFNLDYLSGQDVINDQLRKHIRELNKMVQENITMVQNFSFDLRPAELEEQGLDGAIRELCHRFTRHTNLECTLNLAPKTTSDRNRALTLFRITQEALTNVVRHARATHITITLSQENETIHLSIADNGVGMPDKTLHRPRSQGLKGMQERAQCLGGNVTFHVNNGTEVKVKLPVGKNGG